MTWTILCGYCGMVSRYRYYMGAAPDHESKGGEIAQAF
jgi:hypothetical protein